MPQGTHRVGDASAAAAAWVLPLLLLLLLLLQLLQLLQLLLLLLLLLLLPLLLSLGAQVGQLLQAWRQRHWWQVCMWVCMSGGRCWGWERCCWGWQVPLEGGRGAWGLW